jgi:hypothetical protein
MALALMRIKTARPNDRDYSATREQATAGFKKNWG